MQTVSAIQRTSFRFQARCGVRVTVLVLLSRNHGSRQMPNKVLYAAMFVPLIACCRDVEC